MQDTASLSAAPLILVADDDLTIQEVLQAKLEKSGYRVVLAADGPATLGLVESQRPSLLVLDIKMPGLDGYEICRRLRAQESTSALPILMLTAYGGLDYVLKGLNAGADDYVTKPFHPEEVLLRIRSLLRVRQIEKELRDKETDLARAEILGQVWVTLAHHINNSLAIIEGRAQALKSNDTDARKLKEVCLRQSQRLQALLSSMKAMADQTRIKTMSYAGTEQTMLDLEKEIERQMQEVEGE